jgi:hypothetical protein
LKQIALLCFGKPKLSPPARGAWIETTCGAMCQR